jgi:hypothetical protein
MGLFDFLKKKRTPQVPAEAIMPWVHRLSHFAALKAMGARQDPPRDPMVMLPLNEAFGLCFAALTTDGPLPLKKEHLEDLELDTQGAFVRSMQNLHTAVSSAGVAEGLCIWQTQHQLAGGIMVAGSILWKQLPLKGRPVFMLPDADFALMAGEDDLVSLERMLDLAVQRFDESKEYRSLRAVTWSDGPLPKLWEPPAGHPLRERFRKLAARTRKMEAETWVYPHLETAPAKLAPLGHGPKGLTASWIREGSVLIPADCDRVLLLDTPDSKHPRLEVDLATLRDAMDHVLEPITHAMLAGAEPQADEDDEEEKPLFFRTRPSLFPSARELEYLAQREAGSRHVRDVQAQELLTAWDQGLPVLTMPELNGQHRLDAPDGRRALVDLETLKSRVNVLPAHDVLAFRTGLLAAEMLRGVAEGKDQAEAIAHAIIASVSVGPPGVTNEQLQELIARNRPMVLSSAMREAALRDLDEKSDDDVVSRLAKMTFDKLDPVCVFPVLRPPGYTEGTQANLQGMAAGIAKGEPLKLIEPESVTRPFAEGVMLELVADAGQTMMPLNGMLVAGKLRDAAWRSALLNLEANSVQAPASTSTPGVFEGPWHDDYDAARMLLLPALSAGCSVNGEPLVFAPTVGRTWVTGEDDADGMRAVLDAIDAHLSSGEATTPYQFRQVLFGRPWVLRSGVPQLWRVPEGHPLAGRIAALDAALEQRRQRSAANVGAFAAAVYASGELTERRE